ncbi:hypothetical protein [Actinokineospora bangkokensis]|nr:hypothetical protein [Actinokineospora bangkokensis]
MSSFLTPTGEDAPWDIAGLPFLVLFWAGALVALGMVDVLHRVLRPIRQA